jgi:hypothetical protein
VQGFQLKGSISLADKDEGEMDSLFFEVRRRHQRRSLSRLALTGFVHYCADFLQSRVEGDD